MKLSERLKEDSENIWKKIYSHPFVSELFEGSLPEQKFKFYVLQDYNYLVSSIRNFAILASKAPNPEIMKELLDIANIEATGEFAGYKNFLKKMNLTVEEAQNQKQVPASISYTSFLRSTTAFKSYEEGITALLPCYWSYAEIAKVHKKKLADNENELYREWASYYLKEDYLTLVNKIKRLVDRIEGNFSFDKLKHIFKTSSMYEYLFWDSAYNAGNWNI